VPFDLDEVRIGVAARGMPHQQHNLHAIAGDVLGQRSPDETGSAAHEKLPCHVRSAQRIGCDGGKLTVAFHAASISTLSCGNAFFAASAPHLYCCTRLLYEAIHRFPKSWGLARIFCQAAFAKENRISSTQRPHPFVKRSRAIQKPIREEAYRCNL
jgi:hypothetical protein